MDFVFIQNSDGVDKSFGDYISVEFGYEQISINKNTLLLISKENKSMSYIKNSNIYGYICGYIRNKKLGKNINVDEHNFSALKSASKKWPISGEYTGSYSLFSYDGNSENIFIGNDPIGIYPIYYYIDRKKTIISSSLILSAILSRQDMDTTGIVERLMGPDYSNFGKRTILKNTYRLLPGEFITIKKHTVVSKKYDNRLYDNVKKYDMDLLSKKTIDMITKEVDLALYCDSKVGLAMSGGLDCRLVLGTIKKTKDIICTNYGCDDFYETKIAKQCAEIYGASFENHDPYKYQFPEKTKMYKYIIKTEATGMQQWGGIFEENNSLSSDDPFLLGDTCDLLTAKNISKYRSRKSKIKNYFKYILTGRDVPFKRTTNENIITWKKNKTEYYINKALSEVIPNLNIDVNINVIVDEITSDLKELYKRIDDNNIPYIELYDELFGIYTHGRIAMSKQLLLGKSRFFPIAPIMSSDIAIFSTSIHPSNKIHFKLFNKLFNESKMRDLASIPTAQIPVVPFYFPGWIKLFIWGARSGIDQVLIKLQMKSKNKNFRHRLFKSINWVEAYNVQESEKNFMSWFENDHIGYKGYCHKIYHSRSIMESWPLSTFDIASIGSLNLEIDMIKHFNEKF